MPSDAVNAGMAIQTVGRRLAPWRKSPPSVRTLVGWLAGWLVVRSAGWLVGRSVARPEQMLLHDSRTRSPACLVCCGRNVTVLLLVCQ